MSNRISQLRRKPDPTLARQLEELIAEVVRQLDEQKNCDVLVSRINALSGGSYSAADFFELYGWTSEREAAEAAAMGAPLCLPDLTAEEIVTIVDIVCASQEPESTFFLRLLERSFPASDPSDLIYYPHCELSPHEIADELLLRRQLFESGGAEAVWGRQLALAREVITDPSAAPWSRQWAEGILRDVEPGRDGAS